MSMMPLHVPKLWLHGLMSLAPLAAGTFLLSHAAFGRRRVRRVVPDPDRLPPPADPDAPPATRVVTQSAPLPWAERALSAAAGAGLLAWSLGGGRQARLRRRPVSGRKPRDGKAQTVRRPDGTEIHVETYGSEDGTPIVFVHGLGSDCDEWYEIRQLLDGRYRLIDWDLPGLGESTPPRDGDWSIERLARDLEAVLDATTGGRKAILIGHSLGGMILLTYCRLFRESLRRRVAGLVLAHVTYTNPVKTCGYASLATALQDPVLVPLCRLSIALAPLLRPVCALTYLDGMAHRSLGNSLFTGNESRELLDFLAGYFVHDRPEAIAHLSLAMLDFDEEATLPTISVPTLIVVGDRDDSCTPETHEFIRQRIPGAVMETLSPAKHGGLLEYPEEFVKMLEDFVASCAPEKAAAGG